MLPVMRDDLPESSQFSRPHVVIKLRRGWTYDECRAAFVGPAGALYKPALAAGIEITILPVAAHLAAAKPRTLSPPERELARFYQVVLPRGEDAACHLKAVNSWRCVEESHLPPRAVPPCAPGPG